MEYEKTSCPLILGENLVLACLLQTPYAALKYFTQCLVNETCPPLHSSRSLSKNFTISFVQAIAIAMLCSYIYIQCHFLELLLNMLIQIFIRCYRMLLCYNPAGFMPQARAVPAAIANKPPSFTPSLHILEDFLLTLHISTQRHTYLKAHNKIFAEMIRQKRGSGIHLHINLNLLKVASALYSTAS